MKFNIEFNRNLSVHALVGPSRTRAVCMKTITRLCARFEVHWRVNVNIYVNETWAGD